MKTIIVATQNKGKVQELKRLLADLEVTVKTMGEAGIDEDIEETGTTFEENAAIKAEAVARLTDAIVIADDSGLEIDYLNKEPGIYSARYLGKDTPYEEKNQIILDRLKGVPKQQRTARFICAMAISESGQETVVTRGVMEGYIGEQAEGTHGFGYDPIFFIEGTNTSAASLSVEEKNKMSHRGKAALQVVQLLRDRVR